MKKDKLKLSIERIPDSQLKLYEELVEEVMKEEPDQKYIRELCIGLNIPYSLNSSTQIGHIFKKLQTFKPQVINR